MKNYTIRNVRFYGPKGMYVVPTMHLYQAKLSTATDVATVLNKLNTDPQNTERFRCMTVAEAEQWLIHDDNHVAGIVWGEQELCIFPIRNRLDKLEYSNGEPLAYLYVISDNPDSEYPKQWVEYFKDYGNYPGPKLSSLPVIRFYGPDGEYKKIVYDVIRDASAADVTPYVSLRNYTSLRVMNEVEARQWQATRSSLSRAIKHVSTITSDAMISRHLTGRSLTMNACTSIIMS